MKAIIAAAGTGGHINPGLAIANKIKQEEPDSDIIFIGTNHGLENDLVPRAGYVVKQINAYGFNRKISIDNFKKIYQTFRCIGKMRKTIKEFQPDVVIGTGGYICVPVGLAAKKEKVPLILHESNAFPGVAVKMLSKKADKILVGFEDAKKRLPKAKNVVITGTPTKVQKRNLSETQKKQMLMQLGLNTEKPVVLCFGGSQGAKSINESLMNLILNKKNDSYQIIWAAGPAQYEVIKEQLAQKNKKLETIPNTKIVPYIYNMEEVMNAVDLVISRSGAMTITEIANVGKPAIFIPFPFATENHQEYNAKVLVNAGAAKIIYDKNLTAESLNAQIHALITNKQQLFEMGKNANKVAIPNVEEKIYQEIKKI